VLNKIWTGFFVIAFITALLKWIISGNGDIFIAIMKSTFDMSRTAFEISLGLTGVMTLWLGIMKIGEKGGFIMILARIFGPLFKRLFPDIPPGHPAIGSILMNMSANMLGLDNAATPLGLKAMKEMQELNPSKDTASDAQILFLVINTSAVTLIPVSIFTYRAQLGAADPTDVFIPILLATYVSTVAGLLSTSLFQRINLLNGVVLSYLGGITAIIVGIILYFSNLDQETMQQQSAFVSNFFLFSVIIIFIVMALIKKVDIYDAFIEGAKDGFKVAVTIIPYLVAMLVAIGVFRASGALDLLLEGFRKVFSFFPVDTRFVDALPTALMKPLSGSGARGMMVDTMKTFGVDSFVGRLVSIMQGSTETTFYILAVYFGSVSIRHIRHAPLCGLLADCGGIVAAIFFGYMFFG
jgi:spore maturation protein SpmA